MHSKPYGLVHETTLMRRQHAAGRRQPEDEIVRDVASTRESVGEVATDRDGVWLFIEHHPGIVTCLLAVDDREDGIQLRVTDESVGGLAVDGTEVRLAIDYCSRSLWRVAVAFGQSD